MKKVKHMKQGSLIVLATTLLSAPLFADEEVNQTMDVSDDVHVEIYNTAGSIDVTGWDRNSIAVTGTLGDSVEELIFEKDGNSVLIRVEVPNRHWGDIDADLNIKMPEGGSLEVTAVSADVDVLDVRGEQSLESVSGDIDTKGGREDIEAASVSGDVDIEADNAAGDFEAATVSGDVYMTGISGAVDVESVSGDIDVIGGNFEDVHLETVNGDQTFNGTLARGGDLSMESVNGTVDIEHKGPVSARIDIETFNGSIRNCFGPKPERTSKYSPGLELSFEHGGGEGNIEVETLNGSVNICDE